jgi:hypothetical protein
MRRRQQLTREKITPELLDRVDEALKIKLYPWQRAYLMGEYYDPDNEFKRRNGRTLAYILKLLLMPRDENITRDTIKYYSDQFKRRNQYYKWFSRWALEINDKLTAAGIETCIERTEAVAVEEK